MGTFVFILLVVLFGQKHLWWATVFIYILMTSQWKMKLQIKFLANFISYLHLRHFNQVSAYSDEQADASEFPFWVNFRKHFPHLSGNAIDSVQSRQSLGSCPLP